jgi:hypothetical protein
MEKRITVSQSELATALTIWLRTMPQRIWRDWEKFEKAVEDHRANFDQKPDPRKAVAAHIAEKFTQVKWEVSHDKPVNIYADKVPGER